MDRYELIGRIVFKAKDIMDAFRKLSEHFRQLSEGEDSDLPVGGTDVKLKKEFARDPEGQDLISTIPPPPRVPTGLGED